MRKKYGPLCTRIFSIPLWMGLLDHIVILCLSLWKVHNWSLQHLCRCVLSIMRILILTLAIFFSFKSNYLLYVHGKFVYMYDISHVCSAGRGHQMPLSPWDCHCRYLWVAMQVLWKNSQSPYLKSSLQPLPWLFNILMLCSLCKGSDWVSDYFHILLLY